MSVPLFLLNLPFLLLFLLVLCGRKKKKSDEETPQTPVKIPTTSKTSKVSNEPVKSKEPQKPKQPPKEASPSASTSNSKAADKSKASTSHNGNSNSNVEKPIEPKEIKEEETQDNSEEREIKLVNVILSIHKSFDAKKMKEAQRKKIEEKQKQKEKEEKAKAKKIKVFGRWILDKHDDDEVRRIRPRSPPVYEPTIRKNYSMAKKAYKMHKCTHPVKKKTEDEQCDVCKAYFAWIGMLYELWYNDHLRIGGTVRDIEEDYYDYGGKLPSFLENAEWEKAKEKLKKDMGEKKFDPPVGTEEKRKCQIEEGEKKLCHIIHHVDYWNSPDEEFRQRIAKDFEETRRVYREHDCRGIRLLFSGFCPVCSWYMGDKWTGRLYKEVLENEKRFPDGMRTQLEEDFYFHKQKFEKDPPKFVENSWWTWAKERIVKCRADEENEKMENKQEKPKSEQNKAKDGRR